MVCAHMDVSAQMCSSGKQKGELRQQTHDSGCVGIGNITLVIAASLDLHSAAPGLPPNRKCCRLHLCLAVNYPWEQVRD